MRNVVLVAVVATSLALVPDAGAAARKGTFAGTLGVGVGRGAVGVVRAVSLADRTVVAAKDVGRSGAFSLSLPAGSYLVVGTVAGEKARPVRKQIGVSLRAGQKRRGARLTARLKKRGAKRGRTAYWTESGGSTPGRTAVGINPFGGPSSGDLHYLAGGAADIVIASLVNGLSQTCASGGAGDVVIREVDPERVKALKAEEELGRSPYADRSTFPPANTVTPDVLVDGTVHRDGSVTTTIRDARTGAAIDTVEQELGEDPFDALDQLASKLASKLCALTDAYELRLDVTGHGELGTHSADARLSTTLLARATAGHWEGTGTLQWTDISFTPKTGCPISDPRAPVDGWKATITQSAPGQISVTWALIGSDIATGTIDCPPHGTYDPPPIAGVPAASLISAGPGTFTLPIAGGSQPISGGVTSGSGGFSNTGTLVVRPLATTR